MKRVLLGALLAGCAAAVFALPGDSMPPREPVSSAGFDKMKSLVGSWSGITSQGKPVHVSYKLASDGSALVETIEPEDMVTVYYPDGDGLMMTHYCAMHNQPRMKAAAYTAGSKSLDFQFVDATNMKSPDDGHMHSLEVNFVDPNHITQAWTFHVGGKDNTEVFTLARAK
jgi:hypothetical protein